MVHRNRFAEQQPVPRILSWPGFLLVVAGVAAFVAISSGSLPATVASHFDAAGRANAFMSRASYTRVMLALAVGIPLSVGMLPGLLMRLPGARINLPNREYWLAPDRRDATIGDLSRRMRASGILASVFLGYVHCLVVLANRRTPPELPLVPLIAGLGVFVALLGLWCVGLFRRYRRTGA